MFEHKYLKFTINDHQWNYPYPSLHSLVIINIHPAPTFYIRVSIKINKIMWSYKHATILCYIIFIDGTKEVHHNHCISE